MVILIYELLSVNMAEISQANIDRIVQNYQELIRIINFASSTEYRLVSEYGETEDSINDLEELAGVVTDATDRFKRLNAITIRITAIQPNADIATANMLEETLVYNEARVPAWLRSIEEIINNWRL